MHTIKDGFTAGANVTPDIAIGLAIDLPVQM
jgi:hypothetical protein